LINWFLQLSLNRSKQMYVKQLVALNPENNGLTEQNKKRNKKRNKNISVSQYSLRRLMNWIILPVQLRTSIQKRPLTAAGANTDEFA